MAATHRRRAGWAGAAGAAGALVLGAPASPGAAQTPPAEAPHGQLLQAPDGTLYLLVAGRAHPITPAPLTAEAHEALAAAPPGEALPDGAFWLVPAGRRPSSPRRPAPPPPAARPGGRPRPPDARALLRDADQGSGRLRVLRHPDRRRPRGAPGDPGGARLTPSPGGWPAGQS